VPCSCPHFYPLNPLGVEQLLDVFVWSNFALTRLFSDARQVPQRVDRPTRSLIWLIRMLYEYGHHGRFDSKTIIDSLTYNTKNDKAFSASGRKTQPLMRSSQLLKPRIHRDEIRNIIIGGGERLLSPERRFDAAILNTPGLFI
jgi:hypothetical protein